MSEYAKKYRNPYHKLKPNERHRRITHMSKEIMSACVNTLCLVKEYRNKYLLKNKEVAVDVLNVLDGICYHLYKEL